MLRDRKKKGLSLPAITYLYAPTGAVSGDGYKLYILTHNHGPNLTQHLRWANSHIYGASPFDNVNVWVRVINASGGAEEENEQQKEYVKFRMK